MSNSMTSVVSQDSKNLTEKKTSNMFKIVPRIGTCDNGFSSSNFPSSCLPFVVKQTTLQPFWKSYTCSKPGSRFPSSHHPLMHPLNLQLECFVLLQIHIQLTLVISNSNEVECFIFTAGFIQIVQTSLGQQIIATSAVSSVTTASSAGQLWF
jgi:hypothetical protein